MEKEEKRKLIMNMISLFNSILAIIISLVVIFTKKSDLFVMFRRNEKEKRKIWAKNIFH